MSGNKVRSPFFLLGGFVWLGASFWILLLEFFSDIYLLNLMTLSINGAILYLFLLYVPIILVYWKVRSFFELNRGLLFSISALGYMSYYFSNPFVRGFLLGLGISALLTGFIIFWRDNLEVRRMALEGFLSGLLISLLLKLAWFSRSIVWFSWWTVLTGLVLVSASSYVVQAFGGTLVVGAVREDRGLSSGMVGVVFGFLLFMTHWLLSGYGVIPRWENLDPEIHGYFVISSLGLGLIVSVLLVNKRTLVKGIDKKIGNRVGTSSLVIGGLFFLGGIVFAFTYGVVGEIGGLLFAFFTPFLWFYLIENFDSFKYGKSVSIGITIYVLMAVFSIFTVVFDYVPGGYLFKGAEEVLLLVSILVVVAVFAWFGRNFLSVEKENFGEIKRFLTVFGIWVLILVPVVIAGRTVLVEKTSANVEGPIVALQYNIQQGFDADGNVNFEGVADVIRATKATVVGLQETETMRISTGNKDVAQWLGKTLGMNVFEGPSPKDSTFGNAILSLYPFVYTEAIILPSRGEFAVLLMAKVKVNNTVVNVLSAHFGEYEDDRQAQAEKTAEIIQSLSGPVILLGDFNSVPGSKQINTIVAAGVSDAFLDVNGNNYVPTTIGGTKTIDFVFYSGLNVHSCEVLTWAKASDHYPVLAVFTL